MTKTLPARPTIAVPVTPLTVEEYRALGAADHLRNWELQEGTIVMTPSASYRHMKASTGLAVALAPFVARARFDVLLELDVDLELAPHDGPGTIRQPDLIVVDRARYEDTGRDLPRASDLVLAVEVISPGSIRTDRLIKRAEYADAGIPHYWIVDLDPQPSLTAHRLGADGEYIVAEPVSGTVTLTEPFAVTLDLDALV